MKRRIKQVICLIMLSAWVAASASFVQVSAKSPADIANKAMTKIGCKYVWGACHSMNQVKSKSTKTFDCSGLVNWAAYHAGYSIGVKNTSTLVNVGRKVSIKSLKKGDIIVFGKNGHPNHTGIYVGGNRFVHAPHTGSTVRVVTFSSHYRRKFITARRLTKTSKVSAKKVTKAIAYSKGTYKITSRATVRKKAAKSGKKLGTLKAGKVIKVKKVKNKKWAQITYKGKKAYVSLKNAKKTKKSSSKKKKNSGIYKLTDYVKVRAKAKASAKAVGVLSRGKKVKVKKVNGSWGQITYKGKKRYIHLKHTKKL